MTRDKAIEIIDALPHAAQCLNHWSRTQCTCGLHDIREEIRESRLPFLVEALTA